MSKPETPSSTSREDSAELPGNDPIIQRMHLSGIPLTTRRYLDRFYGHGRDYVNYPVEGEELLEIPQYIRDLPDFQETIQALAEGS